MSERIWKLADLGTKHDLLLGGFGWGNMPLHIVADDLACGRLKLIEMEMLQPPGPRNLSLAEIFRRSEPPGRAGQWLMRRLRALVGGSDKEKERPGK